MIALAAVAVASVGGIAGGACFVNQTGGTACSAPGSGFTSVGTCTDIPIKNASCWMAKPTTRGAGAATAASYQSVCEFTNRELNEEALCVIVGTITFTADCQKAEGAACGN